MHNSVSYIDHVLVMRQSKTCFMLTRPFRLLVTLTRVSRRENCVWSPTRRTQAMQAFTKLNRIILINILILGRLFWDASQIYTSFLVTAHQNGLKKNVWPKLYLKILVEWTRAIVELRNLRRVVEMWSGEVWRSK